jgi:hypothetical protein
MPMIMIAYYRPVPAERAQRLRVDVGFRRCATTRDVADFIATWHHQYPNSRYRYYLFASWQDFGDAGTWLGRPAYSDDEAWIQVPGCPADPDAEDAEEQEQRAASRAALLKEVRALVDRKLAALKRADQKKNRTAEAERERDLKEYERLGNKLGLEKPQINRPYTTLSQIAKSRGLFVDD